MGRDELILKRLLEEASLKWDKDVEFILEGMGKIVNKESKGNATAWGLTDLNNPNGTKDFGLYQFTEGTDNRAHTATNRTGVVLGVYDK